mgnify:CR=1 FL=1
MASATDDKNVIWLTQVSFDELTAELKELKEVTRVEVVKKVSTARDEGDLKENAGYHAARDELGKLDGRIQQLRSPTGAFPRSCSRAASRRRPSPAPSPRPARIPPWVLFDWPAAGRSPRTTARSSSCRLRSPVERSPSTSTTPASARARILRSPRR